MKPSGLYIHIPFCRKKCLYCDFFAGGLPAAEWKGYVTSVSNELKIRRDELPGIPDTLYIGGGTPSLIPSSSFATLIDNITVLTGRNKPWEEFTLEVNPEDVDEKTCEVWKNCGVNRISMGVQSFNDDELKLIGRRHDAESALHAFDTLSKHFDNVNIDLMFGLPSQTLRSWEETVRTSVALLPTHISAYSLMLEEGTAISVLKQQNRMAFPPDETTVKMWEMLSERLTRAGYSQYEISNYAIPGRESIHNRRYWLGNPYLGLGPSAHSYDGDSIRRSNPWDIFGYMRHYSQENASCALENTHYYIEEKLNATERAEEMILTRMRMKEGISINEYSRQFGEKMRKRILENAKPYINNSTLELKDGMLHLTSTGIMIADDIILGLSM